MIYELMFTILWLEFVSFAHFIFMKIFITKVIHLKWWNKVIFLWTGVILEGDMGEVISQNCLTSLFQAQGEVVLHRIYRKNIPKDYHFSSKLQKTVKTSACFKFVGLPLMKWRCCLFKRWQCMISFEKGISDEEIKIVWLFLFREAL